ncbi:MAG: translation initiation factor IF-3 [Chloroflexi bacterium]|nr:translation initiation factor IF-3 [Chloroflexota bacterium]|tara:strand:+ start:10573 stop:11160 length:588 start_codon:yes stop_codon:yes gene_type:complete
MNEEIQAQTVRLVRDGEQVGIVSINEAFDIADEANLDLVEIAPNADPPVVRVMDYGKFKYQQSKKEREARRGSKQVELREVRMRVKIGKHDRDFKVRTARKLLNDGNKVKVSVMFRAREITHPEVAKDLLDEFALELEDTAGIERNPALEGRFMSMTLDPSRKGQRSSIAKENTIEQTDNVVESVNVSESENEIA